MKLSQALNSLLVMVPETDGSPQVISIRNTGIPKDCIANLCHPFRWMENVLSRRHQGSSMGLFITKALVERGQGWRGSRKAGGEWANPDEQRAGQSEVLAGQDGSGGCQRRPGSPEGGEADGRGGGDDQQVVSTGHRCRVSVTLGTAVGC